MEPPVNLDNLHILTDGDTQLEQALFEEFYSCVNTAYVAMERSLADNNNEEWRAQAHAIKGLAYNLGADAFGAICKHAQEHFQDNNDEKLEILALLKAEYNQVQNYLRETLPA